jgi:plasmid maintenance system antidote protein VapI
MREPNAATALRVWMARNPTFSVKVIAAAIGRNRHRVSAYCAGRSVPSLDAAVRLEELTGGYVPAESWVRDCTQAA